MGYCSLEALHTLAQAGSVFLTRLAVRTAVCLAPETRIDLGRWLRQQNVRCLDRPLWIGVHHRLPVRLIATRVSPAVAATQRQGQPVSPARLRWADWPSLITNAPPAQLTAEEALVLARVRWQIELLFKLWKDQGLGDEWRSTQPWCILSEGSAKLIAVVVQHWLLVVSCWHDPERSLVQAAQTIRQEAVLRAHALTGLRSLPAALRQIAAGIAAGCRLNRRRQAPSTGQLLLALAVGEA